MASRECYLKNSYASEAVSKYQKKKEKFQLILWSYYNIGSDISDNYLYQMKPNI